ncbi:MAG TPA: hypothetical protein VIL42_03970 [Sphingomicrobium sp.]|jgi:lipopolysaccharide biosynthesis glycosyltransferase
MAKIFVGYDSREDVAWQVCRHSLLRHSGSDVEVLALRQQALRDLGLYTRPVDQAASTEFSLTRFLTPFIAANDEWAVFCDCDFLFTDDVRKVFQGLDDSKAVYVVKHDYTPVHSVKMDGKRQAAYPRKNWSSFMVFNCAHPDVKALTPELVNSASPAFLHRFGWVRDDNDIGALDTGWNFLAGEYAMPEEVPPVIHYTNGGPWFNEWQDCDFADLWIRERDLMLGERNPQRVLAKAAAL